MRFRMEMDLDFGREHLINDISSSLQRKRVCSYERVP